MGLKKVVLILAVIAGLATGCAPAGDTSPALPPEEAAAEYCQFESCVRNAYVVNDGKSLLVFLDMTDRSGVVVVGDEKFIGGNLLAAGYWLAEDRAEETLFKAELNNQQYYCYSGEDLPWSVGKLAATCAFSAPLAELGAAPAAGDRMRIELPTFGGYAQEVMVQDVSFLE